MSDWNAGGAEGTTWDNNDSGEYCLDHRYLAGKTEDRQAGRATKMPIPIPMVPMVPTDGVTKAAGLVVISSLLLKPTMAVAASE